MLAEFFSFLVQGETRRLGRDLKQHAAGFAEINGMKIRAIDHWRDVVAEFDEMLAPSELFVLVLRAKGNMMHRTRSDSSHPRVRQAKQINDSARRRIVGRYKAKPVCRFLDQTIPETVRE